MVRSSNHNQSTAEIFGLSFHSPLAIKLLVPSNYSPLFIPHDWAGINFRKNLDPMWRQVLTSHKTPLVLAGSLSVLKQFLKDYPDAPPFKTILFEFPGVLVPYEDPAIEWLDCDHQAGGAWQTAKLKTERFAEDLESLNVLGTDGRDLISRMTRYFNRERINEIQSFADMCAEGLPKDYKEYTATVQEKNEDDPDVEIEIDWRSLTLVGMLREVLRHFDDSHVRHQILNQTLAYQLGKMSKREFTSSTNKILGYRELGKKLVVLLKKWLDDKRLGRVLFAKYLDYLCNLERRSWETILSEGKIDVAEEDLLLLISYQPRAEGLLKTYGDQIHLFEQMPSDLVDPEASYQTASGLAFHPDPPDWKTLF